MRGVGRHMEIRIKVSLGREGGRERGRYGLYPKVIQNAIKELMGQEQVIWKVVTVRAFGLGSCVFNQWLEYYLYYGRVKDEG